MTISCNFPLHLLYISTIAGLATTAGCLLIILLGKPPDRTLSFLLAAAGGIMLAVVSLDLLPAAVSFKQPVQFLSGFSSGILFMFIAAKILKLTQSERPRNRFNTLKRLGILIASGIALHDIPEGMAIAVGQETTGKLGSMIALGIALHNLPEGMATATPLVMAGIKKSKIFLLTLGIAFVTPFGAMLGFMAMELVDRSLSFFLALAAGAMSYLVLSELWPLARERYPNTALAGGIAGFIFFIAVTFLLPH